MSFDAVLMIAFGGPQGPADVRPFLANVLRGRRVTPERIEEVAHHYDLFAGVSPLTEITRRQAAGLASRLEQAGLPLPVYVGMRNWHPYLVDTLSEMAERGVRRAIGFVMAPHGSYSSCGQYKQNVIEAQQGLRERALPSVQVTFVSSWYAHPQFIDAHAEHIHEALARLPPHLRAGARVVFTAHSIPVAMAERSLYREQLTESARLIAERLGRTNWTLVYQSRSGRPEDPWLEPDVRDHLRAAHEEGTTAVVLCPLGFVCDHMEVLYDLDDEAAGVGRDLGLPLARAEAVNDDSLFLDAMVDVVRATDRRYARGRPLPIVARDEAQSDGGAARR